ncbi:Hsp20/alpha crystallin family protein [Teladorsagia circumcincta]|uniref:Hsp20/alpha crystallin family protein n=2 Tax=Teladorsagia circumcincta TaxID=45464 RepID=A0A2G9UPE8_TELCI|nr:Hsp20/alpha crystallin family protein [Teladorsagia circumcincta]
MSLWIRPASLFPRFVEEAMRDFRHMERMMFAPLSRVIPCETVSEASTTEMINNESKFAVTIDVSKFKPENLKVNIDGRQLTIEGKEENKEDSSYSMRSFVRQWVLPENVDLEAIKSSLSDSGHLSIEAPKLAKATESGRSIPIERVSEKK